MTNSKSKPRIVQLPFPGEDVHIPLTKGYEAIVSWEDRDLANFKWTVNENRGQCYAVRRKARNGKSQIDVKMHRIILARILGYKLSTDEKVDHKDCNGLNNRRDNLRLATTSQNNSNASKRRTNTSGYKGVYWDKRYKKWRANIRVNTRGIFLGHFDNPEEAYQAYCEAAKKYFGEFARLE